MYFKIIYNNTVVNRFRAPDWIEARKILREWAIANRYNINLLTLEDD